MLIRDATAEDALAIGDLHAESWRATYRGILLDEYLDRYVLNERRCLWQKRFSEESLAMFVLVAGTNTELTGFVCVFPEEDGVFGSLLDNLHVTPRLTGQGIGRLLLSEAARRLTSNGTTTGLYLWVIEQNVRARRFYERAGAVIVGAANNPMPDGQSIVALRCYWPTPRNLIV
jgi:GNAT superfamily N-acetyltransferase